MMQASNPPGSSHTASRPTSGYATYLAIVAAISGLLFGFDTAVINGVLLFLRHAFHLTELQTEIAASSLLLGCLVGAAFAGTLGDAIGRRKALLLSAGLFAASAGVSAVAPGLPLFAAGRLIGGVAIGIASVLTPVYIAEVAPAPSRGFLVSVNQLSIVTGILAAYLVDWSLADFGENSWRWMLASAALPALAFLAGLFAIPESPRWLIANNQLDRARAVLRRIDAGSVDLELERIRAAEREEGDGTWSEVFSTGMRRRLIISVVLAVGSQITGINAILYYGSILAEQNTVGASGNLALKANVAIGLVNFFVTVLAMFLVDRWGRRPMLLVGTFGMFASLGGLVVAHYLHLSSPAVLFGAIVLYVAFFAFGMGPIPWIVISEIFPNRIRGRAASLATSLLWSATLLITFTFLSAQQAIGLHGVFLVFALVSLAVFAYVLLRVPETKGRSLEDLQTTLDDR